ncbi:MAG: flagellar basal body-associated FliL family protein [Melioribacteraceae bacterium]|nr:flagellar basal body-associated FliL family protein [Melioribacteraceae bacterium]MCF8355137.1 flagellar basal body-associated FliL family protein [Melioribacteraceae bacterium]MCF8392466.1 flagellar basal body-associated FliL family protein [Melioribacteraceae bacterium]MCF8418377.1 flagellar basal body-associated FliL family protein [Melioribacteraceae bacterium]
MEEKLEPQENSSKESKLNPKIFLYGIPIFIVQLIIVYIISANMVMSKMEKIPGETELSAEEAILNEEDTTEADNAAIGNFIYTVEDIIINPANTDGQRLMLISLGFDIPSEETQAELNSKEILLKDMIISTISSKTLNQLSSAGFKDSLRVELAGNLTNLFPNVKINRVYFSKYIIQ